MLYYYFLSRVKLRAKSKYRNWEYNLGYAMYRCRINFYVRIFLLDIKKPYIRAGGSPDRIMLKNDALKAVTDLLGLASGGFYCSAGGTWLEPTLCYGFMLLY